jgi:outer membrane protein TolC
VDQAQAGRSELAARLRQAEDGVRFQVADAWRRARAAARRVTARRLAIKQATEAQRLVSKRYANGVTTMVEVLAAQAQLDKARADWVAARYREAVQRAALRLAVGKLEADQF